MPLVLAIVLGTLPVVITLITIAINIGRRLGTFEQTLAGHAQMLDRHADRMERYESSTITFVGDLQRLVGRVEVLSDRREHSRDKS